MDMEFVMISSTKRVGIFCIVWILNLFVSQALAFDYQITELETFGGRESAALDINDNGRIVGYAYSVNDKHACMWVDGKIFDLGFKTANSINNNNEVVGQMASPYQAVIWKNNQITTLDNQHQSEAIKINDASQVVGTSTPKGSRHWNAALWADGSVKDLSPLPNKNSIANSINKHGVIVGFSNLTENNLRHATVWTNEKVTLLEASGDIESEAKDINNNGDIVGHMQPKLAGLDYAMLWSRGKAIVLGRGSALAINDNGEIVGVAFQNQRAMMWSNGAEINLNSLIDPSLGWNLVIANAINNAGVIVGKGYIHGHWRGFVMTPKVSTIQK